VTAPAAVRPPCTATSSDARALPHRASAAAHLIFSGVVTRAHSSSSPHPYPANRPPHPPHAVAMCEREDSAAPKTSRVHVAAASTRRTAARWRQPTVTNPITQPRKKKKAGSRVGLVESSKLEAARRRRPRIFFFPRDPTIPGGKGGINWDPSRRPPRNQRAFRWRWLPAAGADAPANLARAPGSPAARRAVEPRNQPRFRDV
jgi:hypothetical protein